MKPTGKQKTKKKDIDMDYSVSNGKGGAISAQ